MDISCRMCGQMRICDEFSKLCLDCEKAVAAEAFATGDPKKISALMNALVPQIQNGEVEEDNDYNVPSSDRLYHGDEYTGE